MSYPDRSIAAATDLPGCVLWLDAMDLASIVKDGANLVSQWSDKSGLANHATQSDSAKRPVYSPTASNNAPGLDWGTSGTKGLATPNVTLSTHTFFVVCRGDANAGFLVVAQSSVTGSTIWSAHNPSSLVHRGGVQTTVTVSTTWLRDGVRRLITKVYGGTHVSHRLKLNGAKTEPTPYGSYTQDPGLGSVTGPVFVGMDETLANAFRGVIQEIVIYDRALSEGEQIIVERYLLEKWGIAPERQIVSPLEVPGCVAWHDAAQVTLDGSSKVSQWSDLSGRSNHLSQAAPAARPAMGTAPNGRPCLLFDGVDDTLASVVAIPQPQTVFLVGKFGVNTGSMISGGGNQMRFWRASPTQVNYHGGSGTSILVTRVTPENWHVHSLVFAGVSSLYAEDAAVGARANSGTSAATGVTVGSFSTSYADCSVAEVLVYERLLTDGERSLVEQYLVDKYGIAPQRQIVSPLAIPDCHAWLDATDLVTITKDGSNVVSQWNDKSGNGRNVTQANATKRPIYQATSGPRGVPAISFDGVDDGLVFPAIYSFPSGCSIFAVLSATSTALRGTLFANKEWAVCTHFGVGGQWTFFSASDSPGAGRLTDTGPHVVSSVNTATHVQLTMDGSTNVKAPLTGLQARINNSSVGLDPTGTAHPANMRLTELIVFSRPVTEGERVLVERYLGTKYGLFC